MISIKNFIGGSFEASCSGEELLVEDPSSGRPYATLPNSDGRDLEKAVETAGKAFPLWSAASNEVRSRTLHKLSDLVEKNLEEFARAESRDTGKPIKLAREVDIPRAIANLRFFASAIINDSSEAHIIEGKAVNYTRRAPLGIVGCISPWNLPLYLFTWKIAPALAVGNCVIAKPSEVTPYTAFMLCKLASEAGLPEGVLNVLHGEGSRVGQAIVDHPDIAAISFTGGTGTGRIIGQSAARQFKKVSLELGGKNPVLVFADAHLEEAVNMSVKSAFTNQGEICLCGSRIFIQESVYDQFKEAFLRKVDLLRIGDPADEVDVGAIISEDHLKKIERHVSQAREDGGIVLTGGSRIEGEGYYFQPTVIEGLDEFCSINQEEVFGPVVTLLPFSDEAEAIRKANCTPYGLASMVWTQDVKRAHRVSHQLKSGIVWVNCWMLRDLRTPFGGMKNSGIGREGGTDAMRFFTETQNVCIRL